MEIKIYIEKYKEDIKNLLRRCKYFSCIIDSFSLFFVVNYIIV